jgi:hypothetical protein
LGGGKTTAARHCLKNAQQPDVGFLHATQHRRFLPRRTRPVVKLSDTSEPCRIRSQPFDQWIRNRSAADRRRFARNPNVCPVASRRARRRAHGGNIRAAYARDAETP